jgi:hypothetical protein
VEPSPPEQEPRRGKARERQRRRQERQEARARTVSSTRRIETQLSPSGGVKLPEVDMRYVRPALLVVAAVIFMLLLIWAVGLFKNEPEVSDSNAIWLGSDWTYFTHSDDDVRDLIKHLRGQKIGTVYAHVSELNIDGTWTGIPEQQNRFSEVQAAVSAFAEQFERLAPDIDLYGTVIFRIDLDDDGYRLDNTRMQLAVYEFSTHVIETLGFDGVLLQVDPFVSDNDENFLTLIRQVRQSIGEDALLAITIPPDWTPIDVDIPTPSIIGPGMVWDVRYKKRVALQQIDQMIVRVYDSSLTTNDGFSANDYIEWVAHQVQIYVEAIMSVETDTRLLIAVSTTDNIENVHDVQVENIPAAMIGVRQGLANAGEESSVAMQGIAIYADWTTSEVEWTQFEDNWLD